MNSVGASSVQSSGSIYQNTARDNYSAVIIFKMAELIKATSNFSPSLKIGQGGFGTVFKGKLRDGKIVAVKRAKKVLNINFFVKSPVDC